MEAQLRKASQRNSLSPSGPDSVPESTKLGTRAMELDQLTSGSPEKCGERNAKRHDKDTLPGSPQDIFLPGHFFTKLFCLPGLVFFSRGGFFEPCEVFFFWVRFVFRWICRTSLY